MSPALFTILSDVLSRMLADSEGKGWLTCIKISRNCPRITYLMYANDLVVYCKATEREVREIRDILEFYCKCTWQAINWEKSSVHFSHNLPRYDKAKLCTNVGYSQMQPSRLLLGPSILPIQIKKYSLFGHNRDIVKEACWWIQHSLSMAGRLVLIKSVAHALPIYTM